MNAVSAGWRNLEKALGHSRVRAVTPRSKPHRRSTLDRVAIGLTAGLAVALLLMAALISAQ